MRKTFVLPVGLLARWPVGLTLVGLLACSPDGLVFAQALPNLSSLSVGYNSLSAFNAAFRGLVGMSPTQYRASFR